MTPWKDDALITKSEAKRLQWGHGGEAVEDAAVLAAPIAARCASMGPRR